MRPGKIPHGENAPPFTLPDGQGRQVSLGDFVGRHVVLYFYPADDTPGCTKEACGFRDAWSDLQALGAVVLGVGCPSPCFRIPGTKSCEPTVPTGTRPCMAGR
jgi:peroxiredoxin Q/BCP